MSSLMTKVFVIVVHEDDNTTEEDVLKFCTQSVLGIVRSLSKQKSKVSKTLCRARMLICNNSSQCMTIPGTSLHIHIFPYIPGVRVDHGMHF